MADRNSEDDHSLKCMKSLTGGFSPLHILKVRFCIGQVKSPFGSVNIFRLWMDPSK